MFLFYFENILNCFIKIFIFNFFIPMYGEPHHVAQGVVFHAVQVLHFRLVAGKLDTANPCVHLSDSKLLVKWSRPKICIVREEKVYRIWLSSLIKLTFAVKSRDKNDIVYRQNGELNVCSTNTPRRQYFSTLLRGALHWLKSHFSRLTVSKWSVIYH